MRTEIGTTATKRTPSSLPCQTISVNAEGSITAESAGAAGLFQLPQTLVGRSLDELGSFCCSQTRKVLHGFLANLAFEEDWSPETGVCFHVATGPILKLADVSQQSDEGRLNCMTLRFQAVATDVIQHAKDLELMEATARMAQVGGWELERDTGEVRWTAETFRIHELEPGDTPSLEAALDFYTPESRATIQLAIKRAMELGEPHDLELKIITAKGNVRHARSLCRPVIVDGRTVKLRGTFQDVTIQVRMRAALQESETLYRDLFEKSSAIKLLIDPVTLRIVQANAAAVEFYGYSDEDIRRLKITDINIADPSVTQKRIAQVKNRTTSEFEFQHKLASGEIRDVKVHAGTICINQTTFIHSIVFDITERKRAEESLYRIQQLESLGTLAGGIAHDFNNVLTGVFGNLSLARAAISDDHSASRFLDNAENAIARATALATQLLTFSKGGEPERKNVSLSKLIVEIIQFDLSGSNVRPAIRIDDELWEVHVDPGQLQQVFSNLIVNADQAMADGGELCVAAKNVTLTDGDVTGLNAGNYVLVTFTDDGPGIEPQDLTRIFEPYFSTKPTGNGIGLATCYSIISKHHGHIDVSSSVGRGTTFTVFLPAATAQENTSCEIEQSQPPGELFSTRVLVLDDQQMVLDVVKAMLEPLGAIVETFQQTDAAVAAYGDAYLTQRPFDVVILDLTIPGEPGGKDAIRQILSIDPDVKALCSSGYADDPVMARFQDFGFSGVLAKPYASASLRQALLSILAERSDQRSSPQQLGSTPARQ